MRREQGAVVVNQAAAQGFPSLARQSNSGTAQLLAMPYRRTQPSCPVQPADWFLFPFHRARLAGGPAQRGQVERDQQPEAHARGTGGHSMACWGVIEEWSG